MNTTFAITAIVIVFIICATIIITNWRKISYEDKIADLKLREERADKRASFYANNFDNRCQELAERINNHCVFVPKEDVEVMKTIVREVTSIKDLIEAEVEKQMQNLDK